MSKYIDLDKMPRMTEVFGTGMTGTLPPLAPGQQLDPEQLAAIGQMVLQATGSQGTQGVLQQLNQPQSPFAPRTGSM